MFSWKTIPKYLSLGERKVLGCYVVLCLRHGHTCNNPDLSCQLGANVLVCDHRSHVTLYTILLAKRTIAYCPPR